MALCCRQLAAQGLIAGRDGNLSVRLGADRVLVTPSGLIKSLLEPADMVEVDLAGQPRKRGTRKPTSELDLHLRILRHRPDVHAVVHAHPPAATGFAVAGEEIPGNLLPELIFVVGPVPLVPFGMPGTPDFRSLKEIRHVRRSKHARSEAAASRVPLPPEIRSAAQRAKYDGTNRKASAGSDHSWRHPE